ncbi:MAG: hypothetical protein IJ349_10090, partial [Clostridia bacterium]|nr:hypothetical protein [Clostridia bacterium]
MAPALFVLLLLRSTALYRYAVAFLSYVDIAFTFYCLKPNFVLFNLTVDIAFTYYCLKPNFVPFHLTVDIAFTSY